MSFAMGALSRSKDVGLKEKREGEEREREENGKHSSGESLNRQISEASLSGSTEDDDDDDDDDDKEGEEAGKGGKGIDLGPQVSLKEQIEKDKDDESLRRWKEQLLGSVDLSSVGETSEPEVKILSLSIQSPGRPDIVLPLPVEPNSKGVWFTLKEDMQTQFGKLVSKLIAPKKCWGHLARSSSLIHSRHRKRPLHLAILQEDHIPQELSSLTTTAGVTWRSITHLTYAENGHQQQAK
ncbi:rho GDP-dissociation inhibitor 1-like isoform X2 [Ananas comosus]|uniref:Rho GDP-dissociation inhibitor 1-like isoform X2 n=1 Tax=Ananas comosus TaxID=4615 RepID=A0A6P5F3K6_ANACO|nr:rho GDP-dissociation inhibitor 1-like isoform X2 [Ananas comosus]